MIRRGFLATVLTITLAISTAPWPVVQAAAPFAVDYTLTVTGLNKAEIVIQVSGAPGTSFDLNADAMGNLVDALGDITVTDPAGRSLPAAWAGQDQRTLRVQNGNDDTFTIHYAYDALRTIGPVYQEVVFEPKTVVFVADRVFLIPAVEPSRITVRVHPPEGTRVFASLPEENGVYVATKDLWGDLRYDFGKAYFTGGTPLFVLDHRTEWGDLYRYIWFDRDAQSMMWLPSYGNTPLAEAEAYMAMTERLAKYEREHVMGPLPPHVVLFTDARRTQDQQHACMSNTDFFHYMQIWPRDSEGEVAHHLFHAYSFHSPTQSKLSLETTGFRLFLKEGLPTYLELTIPSALEGDDRHLGKVFEFWALEQRGRPFGIQSNKNYHVKYNQSTMRVYLLDRYIKQISGGSKDITDFTRAMWNVVKDRKAPAEFTEADALSAFASVVGVGNQDYIRQVDAQSDFPADAFAPLLPAFKDYVHWMADRWFAGNDLLFLAFLDITAAKGNDWPHYATFPHQVPFRLSEAMTPFWDHLQNRPGPLTEADVLAALHASTGQDHAGFFQFWSAQGYALDPGSLQTVQGWNPAVPSEGDRLPLSYEMKGSLETENHLSGVPQQATAVLDTPAPGDTITIQVTVSNPENTPPLAQAEGALAGANVTLQRSMPFEYRGATYMRAYFQVRATDPERRRFPFTLTMPPALSYPEFRVFAADQDLGTLYFLPPVTPSNSGAPAPAPEREIHVTVDGTLLTFDVSPVNVEGRVLVPLRAIAEALGATVGWDGATQRITLTRGSHVVGATIGDLQAKRDGEPITLDVAPQIRDGRTLVPVRFIAQALGASVTWVADSRTVVITSGE